MLVQTKEHIRNVLLLEFHKGFNANTTAKHIQWYIKWKKLQENVFMFLKWGFLSKGRASLVNKEGVIFCHVYHIYQPLRSGRISHKVNF